MISGHDSAGRKGGRPPWYCCAETNRLQDDEVAIGMGRPLTARFRRVHGRTQAAKEIAAAPPARNHQRGGGRRSPRKASTPANGRSSSREGRTYAAAAPSIPHA